MSSEVRTHSALAAAESWTARRTKLRQRACVRLEKMAKEADEAKFGRTHLVAANLRRDDFTGPSMFHRWSSCLEEEMRTPMRELLAAKITLGSEERSRLERA